MVLFSFLRCNIPSMRNRWCVVVSVVYCRRLLPVVWSIGQVIWQNEIKRKKEVLALWSIMVVRISSLIRRFSIISFLIVSDFIIQHVQTFQVAYASGTMLYRSISAVAPHASTAVRFFRVPFLRSFSTPSNRSDKARMKIVPWTERIIVHKCIFIAIAINGGIRLYLLCWIRNGSISCDQ